MPDYPALVSTLRTLLLSMPNRYEERGALDEAIQLMESVAAVTGDGEIRHCEQVVQQLGITYGLPVLKQRIFETLLRERTVAFLAGQEHGLQARAPVESAVDDMERDPTYAEYVAAKMAGELD